MQFSRCEIENGVIDITDLGIESVQDINALIGLGEFNELVNRTEELQRDERRGLARKIIESGSRVVLVTGPTSSGKTTFANRLAAEITDLQRPSFSISTDDFFIDRDDMPVDKDGKRDTESINAVDIELFQSTLKALLAGEIVKLPTFNFITGKKEFNTPEISMEKDCIVIIEGIHALSPLLTSSIRDDIKHRIYVSPLIRLKFSDGDVFAHDFRLIRRMIRDKLHRGYSPQKTIKYWDVIRKAEQDILYKYADTADDVINTGLIYELSVLKSIASEFKYDSFNDEEDETLAAKVKKILSEILTTPKETVPSDSILNEFLS